MGFSIWPTTTVMLVCAVCGGTSRAGSFAALAPGGVRGDDRLSVIYDARTGEIAAESPVLLFSLWIESQGGVFTGDPPIVNGTFAHVRPDHDLFQGTFGEEDRFTSWTFGTAAQAGLAESFVLADLSVAAGIRDTTITDADLIYIPIPEPSTSVLLSAGLALLACRRQHRPAPECRRRASGIAA